MRKLARFFGLTWITVVAVAGIVLFASGMFQGGRGYVFMVFGAALPGIFAFRWGKGLKPGTTNVITKQPKLKPPIDLSTEASHVLRLNTEPTASWEKQIPANLIPRPEVANNKNNPPTPSVDAS